MRDARWIETWEASPELAMGLDEALLLASTTMPVLRMYTWQPDTLSLGYFQCPSDVPQHLQASRKENLLIHDYRLFGNAGPNIIMPKNLAITHAKSRDAALAST